MVLDGRIVRKRYGRCFTDSLSPPAPLVKGPWRGVKAILRHYGEWMPARQVG